MIHNVLVSDAHQSDPVIHTHVFIYFLFFFHLGCECVSMFSHVWLFATMWTVTHQFLCPWNFPGKNIAMVATSYSGGSSRPRNQTHIFHISWIADRFFTHWAKLGSPQPICYLTIDINVKSFTVGILLRKHGLVAYYKKHKCHCNQRNFHENTTSFLYSLTRT